ncbi:J domain-containing protein [Sporofaciens musculi]|uniref:J domain-containing protein n=1 Tax=Sporofaciens musculi TaxID=2681861 RepID=UPI00258BF43C|nr:J domain-containing protein [Sporofaciens musculi]
MMKWFDKSKLHTVAELRAEYKRLLVKYHPDNGGKVSDMQEINVAYDALYGILSQKENVSGHSYTQEENEEFKAILNAISNFNMTIEVIGSWLWCTDCYAYKNQLKTLGFRWCSRKKAWAWHSEPYRRYHSKEMSLDSIRQKYGSDVINRKSKQTAIG